jgi:hypothetical protein
VTRSTDSLDSLYSEFSLALAERRHADASAFARALLRRIGSGRRPGSPGGIAWEDVQTTPAGDPISAYQLEIWLSAHA